MKCLFSKTTTNDFSHPPNVEFVGRTVKDQMGSDHVDMHSRLTIIVKEKYIVLMACQETESRHMQTNGKSSSSVGND